MNFPSESSPSHLESAPEAESGPKQEDKTPKKERQMSPLFQRFIEKLSALATWEEKIAHGLQFMRGSISQEGSPRFREFWEARLLILPCFKENINPAIRSQLWNEYVELTVEARRLKEILEEQSAFAMEQIDLAIQALEKDVEGFEGLLAQVSEIEFPQSCQTIQQKLDTYHQIQRELNLLNTLASRLNGMRKEILKTEMRMRFKTKFFKRLSELGDHIFPKRKELIDAISIEFEKDVESFVAHHFKGDQVVGAPYYALREEIKALQGMSKVLTLSSGTFSQTRLKLSECWDRIKVLEKEHKREVNLKRQAYSEKRQQLAAKISDLAARSAGMELGELDKAAEEILQEIRSADLQREDIRFLQGELAIAKSPLLAAQEQKARELEAAEREKLRLKRERVIQLKERIAYLLKEEARLGLEELAASYLEVKEGLDQLEITKLEKQQIERSLRPLKNLIADKKESSLLHLSDDQRQNLENLRTVLKQKKERRQEIKDQLETYRKALGSSGLDFEKAMMYREQIDQERELLEKANAGIEEIERKIAEFEG